MTNFQRGRGRAHLGGNPLPSREMYGRVDMWCYGLRRPDTKQLLKKPTQLAGTPEIVSACAVQSSGNHDHAQTLGSFKINGKMGSVAEFASGCAKAFATKAVVGAEQVWIFGLPIAAPSMPRLLKIFKKRPSWMLRMKFPMMLCMKVLQRIVSSITARRSQGRCGQDGGQARDALVRMLKISGARRRWLTVPRNISVLFAPVRHHRTSHIKLRCTIRVCYSNLLGTYKLLHCSHHNSAVMREDGYAPISPV